MIFFKMKVCCVFSFESPHRGDSNKYTQYTIFNKKKEHHPKLSQICSYGIFPRDSRMKSPGRVAQSEGHLTRKSEVLGSIPGLATYFRFSFR